MRRIALPIVLATASCVPSAATEIVDTQATDGKCERLIIATEDLTAECGTALALLGYSDGRVAVSAGTGGQAFFGLGEPERMLLLIGTGKPWLDFDISSIVISAAEGAATPSIVDASGACTYADAAPGRLISCEARDSQGLTYALTYRTDGGDIHRF